MEGMTYCRQRIEAQCRQVREQAVVLKPLGDIFAQEAVWLFRHDQVMRLRELRDRVLHKADNIKRMETAASYGANKASLYIGIGLLASGIKPFLF